MDATLVAVIATLRPSFYTERIRGPAGERVSLCRAVLHLFVLAALLSLPASLACIARCGPMLASISAQAALDQAERLFPSGLELVFNGSRAQLRPEPRAAAGGAADDGDDAGGTFACWEQEGSSWCAELSDDGALLPIRMELPDALHDFFYSELPQPIGCAPPSLPPPRWLAHARRPCDAAPDHTEPPAPLSPVFSQPLARHHPPPRPRLPRPAPLRPVPKRGRVRTG